MASSSSRRLSNGRSPLLRKQSQITAFFSSPTAKPSPSPLNPRATKPPLAVPSPSPPNPPSPPQEEETAVGRRLRVYWPLDDAWYEGRVEGYDVGSRRHRVRYDDGEEEVVDLASERYEWAAAADDEEEDVTPQPARKLRRLRRMSDAATAKSPGAVDGDETGDSAEVEDEDWKKDAAAEDDSEEVELDDEDDDEEVVAVKTRKGKKNNSLSMSASTPKLASGLGSASISGSTLSKKRRKVDAGALDCAKKFSFEPANTTGKVELKVPISCSQRELPLENAHTALTGEVAERFAQRQAEKFKFLGEGRKDAKGRRPGNPNYDPRTLSLPSQFLNSLTGGQRQWWEFKSQHMDKVLFFKMGKFYELFEMDAHVGAKELDLQYMKHMILDAAALENLEILENARNGGLSGTLYAQLNHCVTGFGKRLLKRWIARPLYERQAILQRQSAIATFKGSGHECAIQFRKDLSRLPDMERLLARLFSSCDKNGRSSKSVVLYEDASKRLLHQFTAALRGCQQMFQACSSISKGLPHVSSILDHFRDAFDWSEADRNGRIIPHEGCDPQYDAACIAIEEIESSLQKYLKEQRKLLSDSSVKYVDVGKDAYLLEVSENLRGSVPQNYELQSTKKGFYRYWTPEVKELISELSKAEAEKEAKLKCILQNLIQLFVEHHSKWRQLVSVVAELDVLISLAIASDFFEGPTCCPIIKESYGPDDTPTLHARNLGHPTLRSDSLGSGSFVPNDIKMGGPGNASFIVLTGPNMGGKSTLLRQIGANVPAESFELSLVDRMFVRMGARDHIMAGQSTFLVELMETASVLSSATKNSLVALDELGRGTSTSDGQAIAASVLEYLVHRVQCLGLFSTHYHRLAAENKDSKVSLCHMACEISKGGGLEEVTFLYKLTPGSCPKSYGVNVARLAGIPASVLQRANEKSSDFEASYGKRPGITKNKPSCAQEDKFAAIKDLFRVVKAMHHREDQASSLGMLHEVQKRAKVQVIGE
uniref:DNA mismatch repair protein n=1 Tax=Oryza meridionalis TaxID=40149 RepID=A0A0E0ES22_9ORYZ